MQVAFIESAELILLCHALEYFGTNEIPVLYFAFSIFEIENTAAGLLGSDLCVLS